MVPGLEKLKSPAGGQKLEGRVGRNTEITAVVFRCDRLGAFMHP
jgi:hypothetical protein